MLFTYAVVFVQTVSHFNFQSPTPAGDVRVKQVATHFLDLVESDKQMTLKIQCLIWIVNSWENETAITYSDLENKSHNILNHEGEYCLIGIRCISL